MSIDAPAPRAFLYGWIDTDLPGHRIVTVGASARTISAGYRRFPQYVSALGTALIPDGISAAWSTSTGLVTLGLPSSKTVEYTDRCGEILGMNRRPGFSHTTADDEVSSVIPPAAIWLMGAQWDEIRTERERAAAQYRWRRGRGYVWGGARLWAWNLVMHSDAMTALDYGWVTSGKVSIWAGESTAIGSGQSDGQLDGFVVGIDEPERVGPTDEFARVRMAVVEAI